MTRKLSEVRDEHQPRLRRKRLGCAPISGRPTFGWDSGCTCGWVQKSNEDNRQAERMWRDHTREVWDAERNPRYELTDAGRAHLEGKK